MYLLITLRCINRTPLDTRLLEMAILAYPIGLCLSICIHATCWMPMDNTALWVQENDSTRQRLSTHPYLRTSPFHPPTVHGCTLYGTPVYLGVHQCTSVYLIVKYLFLAHPSFRNIPGNQAFLSQHQFLL